MQNIKKLLAMMLMMASVFFIACDNDDDEVTKMSAEEAQTTLDEMSTSIGADFDMVETDGLEAMAILMNLEDPFTSTQKTSVKTSMLHNLNEFVQPTELKEKAKMLEPEPSDFASYTGTYEWHHSLQRWSVDPTTPTDAIVIKFPSDSMDLDNNNVSVIISNYSEVLISVSGEMSYYNPTSISYSLKIDDVKYLGIDLSAVWNSATGEPTDLTQEIYIKPLSFRQEFENTATLSGVGIFIDNEAVNLFSLTLDATYELGSTEDEPSDVSGEITYGDLKIDVSVDVKNIDELVGKIESGLLTSTEEIENALNDEIDATVYYDGDFVADIELRFNPFAYADVDPDDFDDVFPFYPVFVFGDGSEELAMPFFEELADSIDEFFSDIEDYFDDFFGM